MRTGLKVAWSGMIVSLAAVASLGAADQYGLSPGRPEIKSINAIAFGPAGILFVGDSKSGAVFALQTGDGAGEPAKAAYDIADLNQKLAEALHVNAASVILQDLAVNPLSGHVVVAVMAEGRPALVRIHGQELSPIALENVNFSKAQLVDVPEDKVVGEGPRARNLRAAAITDLAFVDGYVLVAGMNNSADPSAVRSIEFPFSDVKAGTSLEIYHANHGRLENNATVRAFVPFNINGEPNVLAGFTCTPLVRFPVSDLKPEQKTRGVTVAELGNQNTPLDMIVYEQDGRTWLLSANDRRGVMKISTDNIGENPGLKERVGGIAGQSYTRVDEQNPAWQNVVQLDKLNDTHAVVVTKSPSGALHLKSLPLP